MVQGLGRTNFVGFYFLPIGNSSGIMNSGKESIMSAEIQNVSEVQSFLKIQLYIIDCDT